MQGIETKPSEDALNKLQQDIIKQYLLINSDNKSEVPSVVAESTMKTKQ